MKRTILVLVFLFTAVPSFAQFDVRGSLGINFVSTPTLRDYLNQNYASAADEISSFTSSVSFAGEAGYFINDNFQLALDVSYFLNSFTFASTIGQYELTYGITAPSIAAYYILPGAGYYFKFGGGAGLRFLSADEKQPGFPSKDNFTATGFGLMLKGEANTALGSNVYANIGGDIRYDIIGAPENNGTALTNKIVNEEVTFNSLSFGVHLGITYKF